MNKNLLLSATILILTKISFAQFGPGDVGFNKMQNEYFKKAGVKTQTQIQIDTAYGGSEEIITRATYNTDGTMKEIVYVQESSSDWAEDLTDPDSVRDEYFYREDGKLLKTILNGYDEVPVEYGFIYENDKVTESYVASAEARKYFYEYDDKGKVIKRIGKSAISELDSEGNPTEKYTWEQTEYNTYTYNDNGYLTTETLYNMDELYYKVDYGYNEFGLLKEYSVSYQPGFPAYRTEFEYNDKHLLIKVTGYEEGSQFNFIYTYTYY